MDLRPCFPNIWKSERKTSRLGKKEELGIPHTIALPMHEPWRLNHDCPVDPSRDHYTIWGLQATRSDRPDCPEVPATTSCQQNFHAACRRGPRSEQTRSADCGMTSGRLGPASAGSNQPLVPVNRHPANSPFLGFWGSLSSILRLLRQVQVTGQKTWRNHLRP